MEHYTKETITRTVVKKTLVKTTCDRCDQEIEPITGYQLREFNLEFSEGISYPEGGSREGFCVEDICDNCVKFLKSLLIRYGFKITPVDIDW